MENTGGGGSGAFGNPYRGGSGGSGICIVRYTIAEVAENVAKATGGNISFSYGKTYHAFIQGSATFIVTSAIPSKQFC